jgi:hypothetical protein
VKNSNNDSSTCELCGKKFSSFAEMQQHMTIDHMQKGDIFNTMTYNSSVIDVSSSLAKFVTGKNLFHEISSYLKIFKNYLH